MISLILAFGNVAVLFLFVKSCIAASKANYKKALEYNTTAFWVSVFLCFLIFIKIWGNL